MKFVIEKSCTVGVSCLSASLLVNMSTSFLKLKKLISKTNYYFNAVHFPVSVEAEYDTNK